MHRRHFLQTTAAAGAALNLSLAAEQASNKLVVGVMGTGGRGTSLTRTFKGLPNVEIAYTCDADQTRAGKASDEVVKLGAKAPQVVQDFRRILDDKAVDVMVIAACNHWHAPGAILACAAGKHVYVEKPCSHTPREGELMVQAARKHDRRVQMGTQRRSWPKHIEAVQRIREGVIGRPYFAQSWYTNNRPTIGRGEASAIPQGLDYELWQGPSARKPFRSNYLHYNWHWFWNWGNGELGNNGVHTLDLCRWGLGVDYPVSVTSSGGRYRYDDDQETPDTHIVSFDFPDKKSITWEGLSCSQLPAGQSPLAMFVGEKGSLELTGSGYVISDLKGKEVEKVNGPTSDAQHVGNFLDSIRGSAKLTCEIEEAHKSTLMCHLGNIAQRTRKTLRCDAKDGRIINEPEAQALWTKEYAKGWEPKV